jgi:hypothetical protein
LGQKLQDVTLKISNQGRDSLKSVQSKVLLLHQNKIVYTSLNQLDTFAPRSTKLNLYPCNFTLNKVGMYTALGITYHLEDQSVINDTIAVSFEVTVDRDLAIVKLDSPVLNQIYQTKQGMYPRIRVTNLGKDSTVKSVKLAIEIRSSSTQNVWYSDTIDISIINPSDSIWGVFSKRVMMSEIGFHKVSVHVINPVDLISYNDTFSGIFMIQLNQIQSIENRIVTVSPNPVKSNFTLKSKSIIKGYKLVDQLGRIVDQKHFENQNLYFEGQIPGKLDSALYYLIVDTIEGTYSCPIFVE